MTLPENPRRSTLLRERLSVAKYPATNNAAACLGKQWWPIARITSEFREAFLEGVAWSIYATPDEIEFAVYLRNVKLIAGELVAITAALHATTIRPFGQTPDDWLSDCIAWDESNLGKTNSELPPWPWPRRDTRRSANIYRDYLSWLTVRETTSSRRTSA